MKEVKSPKRPLLYYYCIVLLIILLFNMLITPLLTANQVTSVDYGTFMDMIDEGNIGRVQVEDSQILFTDRAGTTVYETVPMEDPTLTERLHNSGAEFARVNEESTSPFWSFLLSFVLPILISVGVPAASAACIFLMAFTTGLACNIANWKSFASIFSLDIADIQGFEIYLMAATAIATLIMVIVEFKRNGIKFAFSAPVDNTKPTKQLTGVRGGLAMITPLIPIVLVAFLKVPVTPAFTVGIIWCLLFTSQSFSKAMNQMTKTCYDGITDAGPAVILMVGIGILFLAVTNASVKEVLNPLLLAIVPTSRVPYIIFFAILAPLALYRGPMNMFGLGSGIAALIIGLGTLNPLAVMAAFLAAERIQCGGDPTNTQNVWTANFCEVDVNTCTKKMLPYLWAVSIVGVILGAMLYF